jgi:hypothetical protein
MEASLFKAGLIAQHDDGVGRPQTERYFDALPADGSLRQAGGSPIPGCYADAEPGTGRGHLSFSEAGASGDRCG